MRLLADVWRATHKTVVYVTHNVAEVSWRHLTAPAQDRFWHEPGVLAGAAIASAFRRT